MMGKNYLFIIIENSIETEVQVGINDMEQQIMVYPNPCHDKCFISLSDIQITKIEMLTLLGNKIRHISPEGMPGRLIELDLRNLNPGVFVIKVSGDEKSFVRQIHKVN